MATTSLTLTWSCLQFACSAVGNVSGRMSWSLCPGSLWRVGQRPTTWAVHDGYCSWHHTHPHLHRSNIDHTHSHLHNSNTDHTHSHLHSSNTDHTHSHLHSSNTDHTHSHLHSSNTDHTHSHLHSSNTDHTHSHLHSSNTDHTHSHLHRSNTEHTHSHLHSSNTDHTHLHIRVLKDHTYKHLHSSNTDPTFRDNTHLHLPYTYQTQTTHIFNYIDQTQIIDILTCTSHARDLWSTTNHTRDQLLRLNPYHAHPHLHRPYTCTYT